MRSKLESLALGVYLPFSRTTHVVLHWPWPSRGSYLSFGQRPGTGRDPAY